MAPHRKHLEIFPLFLQKKQSKIAISDIEITKPGKRTLFVYAKFWQN